MSKIGNYIHARFDNYIKYGITKKDAGGKDRWSTALNSERRRIGNLIREQEEKEKVTIRDVEDIVDFLSDLIYGRDLGQKDYGSPYQKYLYDTMNEIIKERGGGNLSLDSQLGIHVQRKGTTNTARIYEETIKDLQNTIDAAINDGSSSNVKKLIEARKKLENVVESSTSQLGKKGEFYKLKDAEGKNTDLKKALEEIDEILRVPPKKVLGDAFEIFLSLASVMAERVGTKTIYKVSEETFKNLGEDMKKEALSPSRWVGGVTFKTGIHSDFFDEEVLKQAFNQDSNKKDESRHEDLMDDGSVFYDVQNNSTQGKTDVVFSWPDTKAPLNLSAKNYALRNKSDRVHLLSDAPLLTLLQTENSNDFANHYINMVSHQNLGRYSGYSPQIQSYHQVFKQLIFVKAISGRGIPGRKAAISDYLVINNRQQQRIDIFPMSTLMAKARKNIEKIHFSNYPKESGEKTFKNKWEPAREGEPPLSQELALTRIAKLLNSMYGFKIGVEVSQTFLYYKQMGTFHFDK